MNLILLDFLTILALGHNSAEYLHLLVEALRLSFADATAFVADPSKTPVPIDGMLSEPFAEERRSLINQERYKKTGVAS